MAVYWEDDFIYEISKLTKNNLMSNRHSIKITLNRHDEKELSKKVNSSKTFVWKNISIRQMIVRIWKFFVPREGKQNSGHPEYCDFSDLQLLDKKPIRKPKKPLVKKQKKFKKFEKRLVKRKDGIKQYYIYKVNPVYKTKIITDKNGRKSKRRIRIK